MRGARCGHDSRLLITWKGLVVGVPGGGEVARMFGKAVQNALERGQSRHQKGRTALGDWGSQAVKATCEATEGAL